MKGVNFCLNFSLYEDLKGYSVRFMLANLANCVPIHKVLF